MPGIDPVTFPAHYAQTSASVATTVATYPHSPAEPPLACYVTSTCPAGRSAPQRRSTRAIARSTRAALRLIPQAYAAAS